MPLRLGERVEREGLRTDDGAFVLDLDRDHIEAVFHDLRKPNARPWYAMPPAVVPQAAA